MARHEFGKKTRRRCGFAIDRSIGSFGQQGHIRSPPAVVPVALHALTDHDNSRYFKATLALNVSYHLLRAPTHSQTLLLDSMHACLYVDEIVRLIARELVTSEGKGTAVALACCCKSFEDPVLDALWVKQGRLLPLLKSFPRDVWKEGSCTVSGLATCMFPFH